MLASDPEGLHRMTELPDGHHLVYFADPMCSWCWGFSPVVAAIEQEFGPELPIYPVMGDLRPYTTAPATEIEMAAVRSHWEHVRDRSQQKFDFAFFDRRSFVYDTEPSCRAVVVMRRKGARIALEGLRRTQAAFYSRNRDVTTAAELIAIAEAMGLDAKEFSADLSSLGADRETRQDFALARKVGVKGFPTMLASAGTGLGYKIVATGFRDSSSTLQALRQWRATISDNRR